MDYTFKEHRCRLCRKVYCCVSCRKKHEFNYHDVFPDCDICIYRCVILRDPSPELIKHILSAHWPLHCVLCNRLFDTLEDIKMHKRCLGIISTVEADDSPDLQRNSFNNFNINLVTSTPLCNFDKNKCSATLESNNGASTKLLKSNIKSANTSDSKKRVTFCESPKVITFTPMTRNYRKAAIKSPSDSTPSTFDMISETDNSSQFYTARENWEVKNTPTATETNTFEKSKSPEPTNTYLKDSTNSVHDYFQTPQKNAHCNDISAKICSDNKREVSIIHKMDEISEEDENIRNQNNSPPNNVTSDSNEASEKELYKSFESAKPTEAHSDVKLEVNKIVWEMESPIINSTTPEGVESVSSLDLIERPIKDHEGANKKHNDVDTEKEDTLYVSATDLDISLTNNLSGDETSNRSKIVQGNAISTTTEVQAEVNNAAITNCTNISSTENNGKTCDSVNEDPIRDLRQITHATFHESNDINSQFATPTKHENSKHCNESNCVELILDDNSSENLNKTKFTVNETTLDYKDAKHSLDNIFTSTKCSMTVEGEITSPNDIVVYSNINPNEENEASTSASGLWTSMTSIMKSVIGFGPNSIVNSSKSNMSSKRQSEDNIEEPEHYLKRIKLSSAIKCRRTIRELCPLQHFTFKIMIDKTTQTEDDEELF